MESPNFSSSRLMVLHYGDMLYYYLYIRFSDFFFFVKKGGKTVENIQILMYHRTRFIISVVTQILIKQNYLLKKMGNCILKFYV